MGDECAKPGIAVCQRMFSPFSIFQWTGVGALASTPLASGPRNWGQSAAEAQPAQKIARKTVEVHVLLTGIMKPQTGHAVKFLVPNHNHNLNHNLCTKLKEIKITIMIMIMIRTQPSTTPLDGTSGLSA